MGLSLAIASLPASAARELSPKGRLRAALAHVKSDPPLRNLLSLQGVGVVFFTISTPVEVVYAEHTLHVGAGGYGAIVAAWGGGAVLGSLIYARWSRANIRVLLTGGSIAIAVGLGVLAAAPELVIALIGAMLAGIANGVMSTAFMTETQDRTPRDWMTLVTTLLQSIRQISPGLGILLGGVLAAAGSSRLAFGVAAAAVCCSPWRRSCCCRRSGWRAASPSGTSPAVGPERSRSPDGRHRSGRAGARRTPPRSRAAPR